MKILLVNDDGIREPGFVELARRLSERHQVTAVAPDGNRSAVSHGLTMRTPIFADQVEIAPGVLGWAISGTPADCTRMGLTTFCQEPPDLVISGPNRGANVGHDVFYSGTVGAALEASMHGVKAIAISGNHRDDPVAVVDCFLRLLEQIDPERDIRHVLSINLPALYAGPPKGVLWVPQAIEHHWHDDYEHRVSPDGKHYWWISGTECPIAPEPRDDLSALSHGYVTLTPLAPDVTDREAPTGKEFVL